MQDSSWRALSGLFLVLVAACGGGGDVQNPGAQPRFLDHAKLIQATTPQTGGTWSSPFEMGVIAVHVALQPDGRVLYFGSPDGRTGAQKVYAVWNPAAGTGPASVLVFNDKASVNLSDTDLYCSGQTLLPLDGRTLMVGGDTAAFDSNLPNDNTNLFDYRDNSLRRSKNMFRKRWYPSTTTLMNGEVYIQGGLGGDDYAEVREVNGNFRYLSAMRTAHLTYDYPRNWVAPDGRVFGFDNKGEMYFVDPSGTGSIQMVSAPPLHELGASSWGVGAGTGAGAAMFQVARVLALSNITRTTKVVDFRRGAPLVSVTESSTGARVHGLATVLADGRVLSTGGSVQSNVLQTALYTADVWNPITGEWTVGARYRNARLYHGTALLLPDARVLLAGGGAPGPVVNTNGELYSPSYLFNAQGQLAPRPVITKAPTVVEPTQVLELETAAPGISRVTLVRAGSATHSANSDQRWLDVPFTPGAAPTQLKVALPSRATDTPPGFYMLFAFDAQGVPSVARMLRINTPGARPALNTPSLQDLADRSWSGGAVALQPIGTASSKGPLKWAASSLPPGLVINPSTGAITGTPSKVGEYLVTVAAHDGAWSATRSFLWNITDTPPALPLVTSPGPVQRGQSFTFTASSSGTGVRYSWDFGDGSASTPLSSSPNVSHTFARAGVYRVTVTAYNRSGLPATSSFVQTVALPRLATTSPTQSSQIALQPITASSAHAWVVNPDAQSVSVLDVKAGTKLFEIPVGRTPSSIALTSQGEAWVSNRRSSSISVINVATHKVVRTITLPFASQPFGLTTDPSGAQVYVVLQATAKLLRLDARSGVVTAEVDVGSNPRHVAVSSDGKAIYVSRFITPPLPGEHTANVRANEGGADVVHVDGATFKLVRTVHLAHSNKVDEENQGRGIPNYLGAMAISPDGTQGYVPSKQDNLLRGALRDGLGLSFQNTVRAITSRVDLKTDAEDLQRRIDHDNSSQATAAAYDPSGTWLFVALETSREVAVLDAHSGRQLMRINTGLAPQAVAVTPDGGQLVVHNFMDRSVGVYELRPLLQQGQLAAPLLKTIVSTTTEERLNPIQLKGKQLFHDARDVRLARDRYMSCASCHADGEHDGRTWDFTDLGEGLRNTPSLRGRAGMGQGALHWSGNFDELQDFEGQIRTLAGGVGLMRDQDFNQGTRSQPLGDTKVGLSADLDALAAYMASLSESDPSPKREAIPSASMLAGRDVFKGQCVQCHGGPATTSSAMRALHNIGTLKTSSGQRLGQTLIGIDTPTLRDVWATAPYLHDGSAATLEDAVRAHGLGLSTEVVRQVSDYVRKASSSDELDGVQALGSFDANLSLRNMQRTPINMDRIQVLKDASTQAKHRMRLAQGPAQTGVVWAQRAWSTTQSFSTRYTFSLQSPDIQGEGIAFVLQGGGLNQTGPGGDCLGVCNLPKAVLAVVRTGANSQIGWAWDSKPAPASPNKLSQARDIQGQATVCYSPSHKRLSLEVELIVDGVKQRSTQHLALDLQARFGPSVTAGISGATSSRSRAELSFNDWSTQFGPSLGVGNVRFTGAARAELDGVMNLAPAPAQTGAVWGRERWLSTKPWRTQFQFSLPPNSEGVALVLHPNAVGAVGRRNCVGACGLPQAIAAVIHPRSGKAGLSTDATLPTQTLWGSYEAGPAVTGTATLSYSPSTQQLHFEAQVIRNGVSYTANDVMPVNLASRFSDSFSIGIVGGTSSQSSRMWVSDWLK